MHIFHKWDNWISSPEATVEWKDNSGVVMEKDITQKRSCSICGKTQYDTYSLHSDYYSVSVKKN